MRITSGDATIDRILSGETAKIKAGIIAFLRDGRHVELIDEYPRRPVFVGAAGPHEVTLPYKETCELIADGVIEIDDQYRLRLAAGACTCGTEECAE